MIAVAITRWRILSLRPSLLMAVNEMNILLQVTKCNHAVRTIGEENVAIVEEIGAVDLLLVNEASLSDSVSINVPAVAALVNPNISNYTMRSYQSHTGVSWSSNWPPLRTSTNGV